MKNKVNDFVNLNKQKIFIIFVLYCVSACSIGVVNYPYIDDIARRIEGVGNFAAHYSRYLSEFASYIVQGSHQRVVRLMSLFKEVLYGKYSVCNRPELWQAD